ncbi:ABC transporter ATP-binding protein [Oceanibacterium hippocampi]|uniref:Spermidine/putrescine import ATP-binding protein PotA n=1 Tax=Oceanibacterium hippocampi TaxID=745714 RepID=A0A1Y5TWU9_9PROT|nr:ABC transporter ATP-binding protein [Oceanibacterium hippocampi]SLN75681.1 Spermidine/putrescine import ATP-binding protein PotA [Oceanibacterium hippocampi]
MSGAAVSFRGVSKRYGPVDALADFDLEVKPGEFMTFLGPSGSGKTTALNVLAGFTHATAGEVMIDGRSVGGLPPEQRNVGMVFQSYSLFPHMNVFENVAFPLRLRGVAKAEVARRVGESLDMVRLADLGGRMPKELSGGQRQRVAFARAVVFEPPVLLMDEPLGALDLKLRQAMQLEIKRYHAQLGCTIVFVTHDQGEALALSDRIAVMGEGRIAQVDTPDRIYDYPKSRYVAEFIGKTNILTLEPGNAGAVRIVELGCDVPAQGALAEARMISVRPEKIERAAGRREGLIDFTARIDEVLFLGDLVHYSAVLPGGGALLFQEHRGPGATVLARGDTIELGFLLSDALPVSGREAAATAVGA